MKPPGSVRSRLFRLGLDALIALSSLSIPMIPPAGAAPAKINGQGSSYVGLAMAQWVADGTTRGLPTNYLPTNSPQGLQSYGNSGVDFAGTEAEFSALGKDDAGASRGYQYVPDVAGAVAVMYNVDDPSGKKNTTLHLSRRTIALIFMGFISKWDDPAITADNKGYPLPAQPITVVYRSGESGTTALFYDFVANTAPAEFATWAAKNQLPTNVRIVSLPQTFAPNTVAQGSSDQIAQFTGSQSGKWSIAYDEFGYAKTYNVPAAWVQNEAGKWVLPYAANIAAALKAAKLRPDLSQELSGVYVNPDPDTYPISAYSYMVTQCVPDAARATCKGPYSNPAITETLTKWMRYIACEGQINMAQIGYSPLPPNLSNEIAKSIGRLEGKAPEVLDAGNCANPTFKGNLGGGSPPPDPLGAVAPRTPEQGAAGGGNKSTGGPQGPAGNPAVAKKSTVTTQVVASSGAATTETTAVVEEVAAGRVGATKVAGGTTDWRQLAPLAYERPAPETGFPLALIFVLGLVVIPPAMFSAMKRRA